VGCTRATDIDALLAEQVAYYRARAPEYSETAIPDLPTGELRNARDALIEALDDFRPAGNVLELACGPGTWTPELLRHAETVTAVDAAPEMLELASNRVTDTRVRFVRADLFSWQPDRTYDVVFFGFWLSHVPLERFGQFWSLVDRCLTADGRVAFVDDAYRTAEELVEGEHAAVVHRRLNDGSSFRAVKVPHTPEALEQQLSRLGWSLEIRPLGGLFFWGAGARAPTA
jgi:demethylmenaquinone methyltransferase/2-methoxy-6-polyprenyl-1,4-benzoquinol methylase